MQDTTVSRDAVIHHVITDKNVMIMDSRTLMGHDKVDASLRSLVWTGRWGGKTSRRMAGSSSSRERSWYSFRERIWAA